VIRPVLPDQEYGGDPMGTIRERRTPRRMISVLATLGLVAGMLGVQGVVLLETGRITFPIPAMAHVASRSRKREAHKT